MKSLNQSKTKWRGLLAAALLMTSLSTPAQAGILVAAFHPVGLLIAGGSLMLSYPYIMGAVWGVLLDERDPVGSMRAQLTERFPELSAAGADALANQLVARASAESGAQTLVQIPAVELQSILGEAEVESMGPQAFSRLAAALQ